MKCLLFLTLLFASFFASSHAMDPAFKAGGSSKVNITNNTEHPINFYLDRKTEKNTQPIDPASPNGRIDSHGGQLTLEYENSVMGYNTSKYAIEMIGEADPEVPGSEAPKAKQESTFIWQGTRGLSPKFKFTLKKKKKPESIEVIVNYENKDDTVIITLDQVAAAPKKPKAKK